jgi:hypothetical protein
VRDKNIAQPAAAPDFKKWYILQIQVSNADMAGHQRITQSEIKPILYNVP